MLMSVPNQSATVAHSPAIRRDSDPSKHPDFQTLIPNIYLARVQSQVPEDQLASTKDQYDLRWPNRAIVVALVRPVVREGVPEQPVNARREIADEFIWSNLEQSSHRPIRRKIGTVYCRND